MKKHLNLGKNSFSLFETILAITIISIVIGSFLRSSNHNLVSHINLQTIKNKLIQNNSSDISNTKFGLEYNITSKLEVIFTNSGEHTKLTYNKNNIYFEKYNPLENSVNLNFKVLK